MSIHSLGGLTQRILDRVEIVRFEEVVGAIFSAPFRDPFLCITRQRKLSPEPANLEDSGYLIYPFLSVFRSQTNHGQLASIPELERRSIVEHFRTHPAKAETEFSKVFGSSRDSELLSSSSALLHAYFSAYELDHCAEKSVFLLMQKASEAMKGIRQPFDVLKQLNWERFRAENYYQLVRQPTPT